MYVALTVRKLKPGAFDDFRRAWEPEEFPAPLQRAYHVRSLRDENEVVSFGFLDADREWLERFREEVREAEAGRAERMAPFVESVLADGLYEVVDEVLPPGR